MENNIKEFTISLKYYDVKHWAFVRAYLANFFKALIVHYTYRGLMSSLLVRAKLLTIDPSYLLPKLYIPSTINV